MFKINLKKIASITIGIILFTANHASTFLYLIPPSIHDHALIQSAFDGSAENPDGKIRIAMAQINVTVGDFEGNRDKIIDYINQAKKHNVDVIVFPELAVMGYSPEDLLFKGQFIKDNITILNELIEHTKDITVIVGFVDKDNEGNIYNAAAIITDQELQGVYHKKELPNYSVFDEPRYFKAGNDREVFELNGVTAGINVCEDIWVDNDGIYLQQAGQGAKLLINISASPFYTGRLAERKSLLQRRVKQTNTFIVYTNLVGGQDDVVYDGGSMIIGPDGEVIAQGAQFEEDFIITDINILNPKKSTIVMQKKSPPSEDISELETMYQALVLGTRDYIHKNGFKKVVIGISGGIDSALVAAIAVDAIGKENVIGISMPSRYTRKMSEYEGKKLADNLGIVLKEIPIEETFKALLSTLNGDTDFASMPPDVTDVTEENLQARIRGNILMAQSNKFGWLVLSTSNKSESAVGYTTLYGDMSGGFAPIQDVYKTIIFKLAWFYNQYHGRELIPQSTITRRPSAELKDNQHDDDTLPPYEILDMILQAYIERNESIEKISQTRGLETIKGITALVDRVAALVDRSEHKRRQAPPGLKITRRSLGKDWRLPITNSYRNALALDRSF